MADPFVPLDFRPLIPALPVWSRAASAFMAPVLLFFSVPALMTLGCMLVLDFVTGMTKARLLKKVSSARLGDLFHRAVYYFGVFLVLHLLTVSTPQPFNLVIGLFEGFVMSGYLFKEAISVLENMKAIQMVRGVSDPILDLLIDKLGIDSKRILKDFENTDLLGRLQPREGWRLPEVLKLIRRPRVADPKE